MPHNTSDVAMHHYAATKVQALVHRLQFPNKTVLDTAMMCTGLRFERLLKLKEPTPDDIVWDEVQSACRNLEKERISPARFASIIRTLLPQAFVPAPKAQLVRESKYSDYS